MERFGEAGTAPDAEVAILGVPWDGGTAVPVGAVEGPAAIRAASRGLRRLDPVTLAAPYDLARVADLGDLAIAATDRAEALDAIAAGLAPLFRRGVRTVALGGDHLITLPILRALAPRGRPRIVHVDAHSDTADRASTGERLSSATPFRRAIEEGLVAPHDILQIGLRGTVRTPDRLGWARDQGVGMITMDDWVGEGAPACLRRIRAFAERGPVYVTVDIDGIDPVYAPGTGARVPGGLSAAETLALLRVLRGLDVVGCDLTEVAPPRDIDGLTAALAAALAFEMVMLTAVAARR